MGTLSLGKFADSHLPPQIQFWKSPRRVFLWFGSSSTRIRASIRTYTIQATESRPSRPLWNIVWEHRPWQVTRGKASLIPHGGFKARYPSSQAISPRDRELKRNKAHGEARVGALSTVGQAVLPKNAQCLTLRKMALEILRKLPASYIALGRKGISVGRITHAMAYSPHGEVFLVLTLMLALKPILRTQSLIFGVSMSFPHSNAIPPSHRPLKFNNAAFYDRQAGWLPNDPNHLELPPSDADSNVSRLLCYYYHFSKKILRRALWSISDHNDSQSAPSVEGELSPLMPPKMPPLTNNNLNVPRFFYQSKLTIWQRGFWGLRGCQTGPKKSYQNLQVNEELNCFPYDWRELWSYREELLSILDLEGALQVQKGSKESAENKERKFCR